ncbi:MULTISPECIES: 2-hydroxyacid dehydrogenase [Bacillus]|uniref:2-hydroxyacid dehydrogenase n=1 Tax=Bacillus TaxID=1386 RepID=UPI0002EA41D0|nr:MULTISPECIES: D-glycerate dehydrogenase [Bacillus]
MAKPKIIVYKRVPEIVLEKLQQECEVVYFERLNNDNFQTFFEELKDAHGLLGSELKIDSELLNQAPHLKIVSNIAVGYDNFDMDELTKRNIMATNTPDVLNETTADTIFGLILATARRFPELDQFVKNGQWIKSVEVEEFGVDVHHKTLGIIGMGGIGSAIAKRAHYGFDMNILYHNRSRNETAEKRYNAKYCSLDELLEQSDFVCLMTPLTPQTEKLIGEKEFKLMKETAFFINGSRGKTVDEAAMIQALKEKEIAGAGLDVFETEPVNKDNPLLSMKNVITLPHIGSATLETRTNMSLLAANNLLAGLTGKRPAHLINEVVM